MTIDPFPNILYISQRLAVKLYEPLPTVIVVIPSDIRIPFTLLNPRIKSFLVLVLAILLFLFLVLILQAFFIT